VLNSLLSPLRIGVVLAIVLALVWRWLPRWLRRIALLPLLTCLALSLPLLANSLVRYQEARVPPARICKAPLPGVIVVVSGGSVRKPVSPVDVGALGESSLRRTMAAVALWREEQSSRLLISGGAGHYPVAESVLMAEFARHMGVAAASIEVETGSRSTWQNAQFVREMVAGADRRIALVTSALHMSRALYAFEQAGFEVCTWPADSRDARANSLGYYLPSTAALDKSEAVIHEWVGEFAYRRGWLRSLSRDPWASGDEQ
jgi:uncharacterized SAM-binding protein YcdF (DUF218 family)